MDFDTLLNQMHQANSKIQLVKRLKIKTKELHKKYNSVVDTTDSMKDSMKITSVEKFSSKV